LEKATARMTRRKKIVLIAHDNIKVNLLEWAKNNRDTLKKN
jgi:methylglyoxal synthase